MIVILLFSFFSCTFWNIFFSPYSLCVVCIILVSFIVMSFSGDLRGLAYMRLVHLGLLHMLINSTLYVCLLCICLTNLLHYYCQENRVWIVTVGDLHYLLHCLVAAYYFAVTNFRGTFLQQSRHLRSRNSTCSYWTIAIM